MFYVPFFQGHKIKKILLSTGKKNSDVIFTISTLQTYSCYNMILKFYVYQTSVTLINEVICK